MLKHHARRAYSISMVFLITILARTLSPGEAVINPAQSMDLHSVISEDAEVFTREDGQKAILPVDLDRDGHQEVVVFLLVKGNRPSCEKCKSSRILVAKPGEQAQKLWESEVIDGNYWVFPPTSIEDVNADGNVEIVALCSAGTSAGGILNLYTWTGKGFVKLAGEWNRIGGIDGVEFQDLNGDGVNEIIIIHSTGAHQWNQGLPDVYKWTGKSYQRSNATFPHYYSNRISEAEDSLYSDDPIVRTSTLGARLAKLVVQGYYYQGDYDRVYEAYKKLLSFDPGYRTTKLGTPQESAAIHEIVGDSFLRDGNRRDALSEYKLTLELNPQAEHIKEKITHVKKLQR
jgi:hypothetical protein